jgi:hypothetical protein
MAQATPVPFDPYSARGVYHRAAQLRQEWEAFRAASRYVQELDQLVVRHDLWGAAYASAEDLVDAASSRVASWSWRDPQTGRGIAQGERVQLLTLSRLTLEAIRSFDWTAALASLWWSGLILQELADQLGVEL